MLVVEVMVTQNLQLRVYRGDLLSLEKESSKETSKKTKIAKRQKPTLYGKYPKMNKLIFG